MSDQRKVQSTCGDIQLKDSKSNNSLVDGAKSSTICEGGPQIIAKDKVNTEHKHDSVNNLKNNKGGILLTTAKDKVNTGSEHDLVNKPSTEAITQSLRKDIDELTSRSQELIDSKGSVKEIHDINLKLSKNLLALSRLLISKEINETVVLKDAPEVSIPLGEIPKFQLDSWEKVNYPFEEGNRFRSVDHFLYTFESVLKYYGQAVEEKWSRYMPFAIPYYYQAWGVTFVMGCKTWEEVREVFNQFFCDFAEIRESRHKFYRISMAENESVNQYTIRFLNWVQNAKYDVTDQVVRDVYLLKLYKPLFRLVTRRLHKEEEQPANHSWSVCKVADVARSICGDTVPVNEALYWKGRIDGINYLLDDDTDEDEDELPRKRKSFGTHGCFRHGGPNADHREGDCERVSGKSKNNRAAKRRRNNGTYQAATTSPDGDYCVC